MKIVCIDGEQGYRELVRDRLGKLLVDEGHELAWFEESSASAERWAELGAECEAILLIGDRGPIPPNVFERCPSVRVVSVCAAGVRKFVDLDAARRNNVTICHVPGSSTESVAEHTVALMFAVARRLTHSDRIVRSGRWEKLPGLQLIGRTLGVVGAGPIATSVIRRAKALGLKPICWSRNPSPDRAMRIGAPFVSLEELFQTSHIVTIHLAHSPETERIIDRSLLRLLQEDAIFINTARAELVDNNFLRMLLEEGAIFGAGIDVFDEEPPDIAQLALSCENLVLTPHIGFHTKEATEELFRIAINNLLAFARGAPMNVVQ